MAIDGLGLPDERLYDGVEIDMPATSVDDYGDYLGDFGKLSGSRNAWRKC